MSKPDRATTERNTKTLRELVKRPENKVCADCKRNDPRWASWNLGVFLCIRCSGIHRGMGTHISKVKSVDLDSWTPEQMEMIQKWGNRLANLYWEAHLKPGHIPPDHKVESFIRSKYESRRWAMDGPPPMDPSSLDNSRISEPEATVPTTSSAHNSSNSVSAKQNITSQQPQPHQLLSATLNRPASLTSQKPTIPPPVVVSNQPVIGNDLFSLDFHAPTPPTVQSQPQATTDSSKNIKQDILSLFSNSTPTVQPGTNINQADAGSMMTMQGSMWNNVPQQPFQQTSMMGTNGVGMWGASSGWNPSAAAPNVWDATNTVQTSHTNPYASSADIWGGGTGNATKARKDDAFDNLWN